MKPVTQIFPFSHYYFSMLFITHLESLVYPERNIVLVPSKCIRCVVNRIVTCQFLLYATNIIKMTVRLYTCVSFFSLSPRPRLLQVHWIRSQPRHDVPLFGPRLFIATEAWLFVRVSVVSEINDANLNSRSAGSFLWQRVISAAVRRWLWDGTRNELSAWYIKGNTEPVIRKGRPHCSYFQEIYSTRASTRDLV